MLVNFDRNYTRPAFQRRPRGAEIKQYTKTVSQGLKVLDKKVGVIVHNSAVPSSAGKNIGIGSLLSKNAEKLFIPFLAMNAITSIQQEPDNSYYVLFRAKILVQKGDYIRAASLLDVFARTDTENRDYLFLRAKVQKDWNRNITAALSTIEKAITLYPDDIGIILAAAQIAFETRSSVNGKSANELAAIVLSKDSSNVAALEIQINDLIQSKKWDIAYKSSSDLIKLNDSSNSALFTHISVCLAVGKKEEAWKIVSGLYEKKI